MLVPFPSSSPVLSSYIPSIPDEDEEENTVADISRFPTDDSQHKENIPPRRHRRLSRTTSLVSSRRPPPPLMRKASFHHPDKYQRLQKAAVAEPQLDFKTLLVSSIRLKDQPFSDSSFPRLCSKKLPPPPIATSLSTLQTPPLTTTTSQSSLMSPMTPRTPPSSPKPKPWRGNSALPKRPPLPQWDLVYPDLAVKKTVLDAEIPEILEAD
ncbi:uncharacterized protein EV420DRAFT_1677432 [Desarmillaria tabescens]|uniref:Uncharacterized protein n=1 Tax=Armillaria tabescens TaxID=1929756 RepID=A0AA39KDY5_ARMTA|nr:uncharacterized protein EV420DRAFT_1677432 [Desarmillaria tabescens]KAK0459222.1 hypothetical protein EV420DRAFT_1677432 [Desarmillaria tabescens]